MMCTIEVNHFAGFIYIFFILQHQLSQKSNVLLVIPVWLSALQIMTKIMEGGDDSLNVKYSVHQRQHQSRD